MAIEKVKFGTTPEGKEVFKFTIVNQNDIVLKVINYGATLYSLDVPDKKGKALDVVLGYDDLDGYINDKAYLGSTVGRYANRIKNSKFSIDDIEYPLTANEGNNHLHGGKEGFNKKVWDYEVLEDENAVKFTYVSPDGEEGYPGELKVSVTYSLTKYNEVKIDYEANTNKKTHVNLTNHAYFNLTGTREDISNHLVKIYSDRYTVNSEDGIPSGIVSSIRYTALDLRVMVRVGERIDEVGGFDHNYILSKCSSDLSLAAELWDENSGRCMEVYTTEPAIQFYSGNAIGEIKGRSDDPYRNHSALCLEAQHYPDSPNQEDFPSTILHPDDTYKQTTVYKFLLL